MISTPRGLRLLKLLENYKKLKPYNFDASIVLSKLNIHAVSNGGLFATFLVDESMCNSMDYLHGGFVSSVMDVAATYGQMSHEKGAISWTTGFNLVYLSSASKGDQIIVESKPLRMSGRLSVIEATLTNECKNEIIAKGTLSFITGNDKLQEAIKKQFGDLNAGH